MDIKTSTDYSLNNDLQRESRKIFLNYINEGAVNSIKIPTVLKQNFKDQLQLGIITAEYFEPIRNIIFEDVRGNCFKLFIESCIGKKLIKHWKKREKISPFELKEVKSRVLPTHLFPKQTFFESSSKLFGWFSKDSNYSSQSNLQQLSLY